jgi:uncharacterized protein (DUF2249 family)
MPLRPILLDLHQPRSDLLMHALAALEDMEAGDTLLVELDRDPQPLLNQLRPILESGFSSWVVEEGPEIWRVMIYRSAGSADEGEDIEK